MDELFIGATFLRQKTSGITLFDYINMWSHAIWTCFYASLFFVCDYHETSLICNDLNCDLYDIIEVKIMLSPAPLFLRLKPLVSLYLHNHLPPLNLLVKLPSTPENQMEKIPSLKLQKLDWDHLQPWQLQWSPHCLVTLGWFIIEWRSKPRNGHCRSGCGACDSSNCSLYCTWED